MIAPEIPRGEWTHKKSFRPSELAQVMRVTVTTVTRLAQKDLIPSLRTPGDHRRYWRPDLPWLPQAGDPQLLRLVDVAELFSADVTTIRRWIDARMIERVPVPGVDRPRYRRADVDQLLIRRRRAS